MKQSLLLAVLTVGLLSSCKKEKTQPKAVDNRPPKEVIGTLTQQLSDADSISIFTNALKNLSLKEEETAMGLTVFAPLNEVAVSISKQKAAIASSKTSESDAAALTDTALKDHIVKGILKATDLIDGKILTTLSGKELKITKEREQLWINGVLISGTDITSGSKEAVYVVQKRLTNTFVSDKPETLSNVEITVWNTFLWSEAKPQGEPAADAIVYLYQTPKDFFTNKRSVYQGKTNAEGKIKFSNLPNGKYFIAAVKDELRNVLAWEENLQDSTFRGHVAAGIFQSAADISSSAKQPDAMPGNIKWKDINSDGVIDFRDLVTLPGESVETGSEKNLQVSILIGYENNVSMWPAKTEVEALGLMESAAKELDKWHKNMVMLDGVLSDDSGPVSVAYEVIDLFQLTPSNSIITQNWLKAYEIISALNKIIKADIPIANKEQLQAQAKAMRAYIYMQLRTYYGNIPLQLEPSFRGYVTNTNPGTVSSQIKNDLTAAAAVLSNGGTGKLSPMAVKALLAKFAFQTKDLTAAIEHAGAVIESAQYQLVSTAGIFNTGSKETIWGGTDTLSYQFSSYFFNRQSCPYIRLAEVYLMGADANLAAGKEAQALSYLNTLRGRRSMAAVDPNVGKDSISNAIRKIWKTEMQKEGGRFANLVRWNMAQSVLEDKGYMQFKHRMLPIPEVILGRYPAIRQNDGY